MARVDALGDGPVVFFTKGGTRIEVPLSLIKFDDGKVVTTRGNDPNSADLQKWLEYLAMENRLTPGLAPPLAPAVVFTAANAGALGNNIQIIVTGKTPLTVDITATSTDRYEGLTRATLDATLGTSTAAGSKPGLLRVQSNPPAGVNDAPNADDPDVVADTTGAVPTWTIAGAGGANPAVLEPRYQGAGVTALPDDQVTVSVTGVTAAHPTFTLTVVWKYTAQDVDKTHIPATLGALVKVSPPSAAGFVLPRPGVITLSGGSEPKTAVPATATALASA
jgi:hypothetical protein